MVPFAQSASVKPQPPCLQGTYTLDVAASDDVSKAIEDAVKRVILGQTVARNRLRKITVSFRQISISYTNAEISIAADDLPPLRTPVDGPPVEWTSNGEKLKVSTV